MVHQQLDVSDQWLVIHNLNTFNLSVDCWVDVDGVKTKILPVAVRSIDDDNVKVLFSRPYKGEANVVRQKCWSDNQ